MKITKLYQPNLSLLTDLYQLTMAYGYWKAGIAEQQAIFHLFFRKPPFQNNYTIACGLQMVIDFIQDFRFEQEDIDYLASLTGNDGQALFEAAFLEYLTQYRFQGNIDAVPEGTVVFPHEPILRVQADLIIGQLIETALLNMINFQTLIATKAARVCQAAQGEPVLEFGLRRAQGIDGALSASRAAYIGGCVATSNVLAGRCFDIPVKGTHAHSWVMCFSEELTAFETYAETMPNNCIFLVDTYDTIQGVKNAIKVGKQLQAKGHQMIGVRLDSGDLAELSKQARKLLDEAGFTDAVIVASDGLEEHKIKALKEKGAKIGVWGVGTNLVTAKDQPALGGVYKLGAIQTKKGGAWEYRMKLSEQPIKVSNPGCLQIHRFIYRSGRPASDVIYNTLQPPKLNDYHAYDVNTNQCIFYSWKDAPSTLLVPIFKNGDLVYASPTIHHIRQYAQQQINLFKTEKNYVVGLAENLHYLKADLMQRMTGVDGR